MASTSIKRKALSLQDKIKIISQIKNGRKQADIVREMSLSRTTVSTIWSNREKYETATAEAMFAPSTKRLKTSSYTDVDAALLIWFKQIRSSSLSVSGPLLQEKANAIASELGISDFCASSGFVDRFKSRHNIVFKTISGEEKDVTPQMCEQWQKEALPALLSQYSSDNIFNADETGLYYKMTPNKTMCFRGEKCSGGKQSKDRLTLLMCASVSGEKLPLLVIGKSKQPRCFKNIRTLPCQYTSNTKAWMTGVIFKEWVEELNTKMKRQGRNIVLVLDNCSAHPKDLNMSNVQIVYLPPNTTSKLQPLDQGVIQNFKTHYRRITLRRLLNDFSNTVTTKPLTVLDALIYSKTAWDQVTPQTITNCFKHCGFQYQTTTASDNQPSDDVSVSSNSNDEDQALNEYLAQYDSSLQEYASLDNGIETSGLLSLSEIAAEVRNAKGDENEDVNDGETEDVPVVPTRQEFSQMLDKIRLFVMSQQNGEKYLDNVNQLERLTFIQRTKQTKISQFMLPIPRSTATTPHCQFE